MRWMWLCWRVRLRHPLLLMPEVRRRLVIEGQTRVLRHRLQALGGGSVVLGYLLRRSPSGHRRPARPLQRLLAVPGSSQRSSLAHLAVHQTFSTPSSPSASPSWLPSSAPFLMPRASCRPLQPLPLPPRRRWSSASSKSGLPCASDPREAFRARCPRSPQPLRGHRQRPQASACCAARLPRSL